MFGDIFSTTNNNNNNNNNNESSSTTANPQDDSSARPTPYDEQHDHHHHHHHEDEDDEDDDDMEMVSLLGGSGTAGTAATATAATSPTSAAAAAVAAVGAGSGGGGGILSSFLSHKRRRNSSSNNNININNNNMKYTSDLDVEKDILEKSATTASTTTATATATAATNPRLFFVVCKQCCFQKCCCTKACGHYMNYMARVVLWCTVLSLIGAVFWYSYELHNHGTDPHLIAWFSAGAFVLLGFPISMWGVVGHLANYNQPHVQMYIVRILWMVPIYSIESWLAMRFHKQAIYIETLRDFYESYVLYCFTQFLTEVLGGEEALILMLKDKSPTRGVHMWGFQWCIKPWLMGQPVRKIENTKRQPYHHDEDEDDDDDDIGAGGAQSDDDTEDVVAMSSLQQPQSRRKCKSRTSSDNLQTLQRNKNKSSTDILLSSAVSPATVPASTVSASSSQSLPPLSPEPASVPSASTPSATSTTSSVTTNTTSNRKNQQQRRRRNKNNRNSHSPRRRRRPTKKVYWKSPFFVKCKFGVLQYVLLKFLCAVAVLILEWKKVYHEGDFSWKSGYLYICILTNVSQCWALYCLIFFYYATKTELSPIRPVGKFLSVKALVFFTWWQSVFISVLYQMDMIPNYTEDWTPEDVAKGIQDYLICVEMFVAAVVHTFVFPHSEYSPQAVEARMRALNHQNPKHAWQTRKRLGRTALSNNLQHHHNHQQYFYNRNQYLPWKDDSSKNSNTGNNAATAKNDNIIMEMTSIESNSYHTDTASWVDDPLALTSAQTLQYQQPMARGGPRSSAAAPPSTFTRNRATSWDSIDESPLSNLHLPLQSTISPAATAAATTTTPSSSNTTTAPISLHSRHYSYNSAPLTATQPQASQQQQQSDTITEWEDDQFHFHNNNNRLETVMDTSTDATYQHKDDSNNKNNSNNNNNSNNSLDHPNDTEYRCHSSQSDPDDYSDYEEDEDHDDEDDDEDYDEEDGRTHRNNNNHNQNNNSNSNKRNNPSTKSFKRPGFVRALLDSAIPVDLRDNTVGIVTGEYNVEKKTLLHHAATSDQYDLFSNRRPFAQRSRTARLTQPQQQQRPQPPNNNDDDMLH